MKILIVRFSSIGDIVLCSPVIRCLKLQKKCEIHFLTKSAYKQLLDSNPYVDKLWTIEKNISEIASELTNEGFDEIIDLHHNLRTLNLQILLRKRAKSFDKINVQKWLKVNFKKDYLPEKHIVDRYMATVEHLRVKNDNEGLDYFVGEGEKVEEIFFEGKEYIAFAIGANHATKCYPEDKIAAFLAVSPLPVLLLGGKAEQALGERLAKIPNTASACGIYNLDQSAILIEKAQLLITHDTGLMHIAAALNKKMVSIWGNTIPEFGMYPYYGKFKVKNVLLQHPNLKCRPCSKIGFKSCPENHFDCMRNISTSQLLEAVDSLI